MIRPVLAATPALKADACPPLAFRIGTTLGPYPAMTSRDPSVEPSSTTRTSTGA